LISTGSGWTDKPASDMEGSLHGPARRPKARYEQRQRIHYSYSLPLAGADPVMRMQTSASSDTLQGTFPGPQVRYEPAAPAPIGLAGNRHYESAALVGSGTTAACRDNSRRSGRRETPARYSRLPQVIRDKHSVLQRVLPRWQLIPAVSVRSDEDYPVAGSEAVSGYSRLDGVSSRPPAYVRLFEAPPSERMSRTG
jgi:hypothetical protein